MNVEAIRHLGLRGAEMFVSVNHVKGTVCSELLDCEEGTRWRVKGGVCDFTYLSHTLRN
jgi:hypothetical protein